MNILEYGLLKIKNVVNDVFHTTNEDDVPFFLKMVEYHTNNYVTGSNPDLLDVLSSPKEFKESYDFDSDRLKSSLINLGLMLTSTPITDSTRMNQLTGLLTNLVDHNQKLEIADYYSNLLNTNLSIDRSKEELSAIVSSKSIDDSRLLELILATPIELDKKTKVNMVNSIKNSTDTFVQSLSNYWITIINYYNTLNHPDLVVFFFYQYTTIMQVVLKEVIDTKLVLLENLRVLADTESKDSFHDNYFGLMESLNPHDSVKSLIEEMSDLVSSINFNSQNLSVTGTEYKSTGVGLPNDYPKGSFLATESILLNSDNEKLLNTYLVFDNILRLEEIQKEISRKLNDYYAELNSLYAEIDYYLNLLRILRDKLKDDYLSRLSSIGYDLHALFPTYNGNYDSVSYDNFLANFTPSLSDEVNSKTISRLDPSSPVDEILNYLAQLNKDLLRSVNGVTVEVDSLAYTHNYQSDIVNQFDYTSDDYLPQLDNSLSRMNANSGTNTNKLNMLIAVLLLIFDALNGLSLVLGILLGLLAFLNDLLKDKINFILNQLNNLLLKVNSLICKLKSYLCLIAGAIKGVLNLVKSISDRSIFKEYYGQLKEKFNTIVNDSAVASTSELLLKLARSDKEDSYQKSLVVFDNIKSSLGEAKALTFMSIFTAINSSCTIDNNTSLSNMVKGHLTTLAGSLFSSINDTLNSALGLTNTSECKVLSLKPVLNIEFIKLRKLGTPVKFKLKNHSIDSRIVKC